MGRSTKKMVVKHMDSNSLICSIAHPTMDPQEITDCLGVDPYVSQKYGEVIRTPEGEKLSGTYEFTKWSVRESGLSSDVLLERLSALLDFLSVNENAMISLYSKGACCSVYFNLASPQGIRFIVPVILIEKMAKMKISFGIEVFG